MAHGLMRLHRSDGACLNHPKKQNIGIGLTKGEVIVLGQGLDHACNACMTVVEGQSTNMSKQPSHLTEQPWAALSLQQSSLAREQLLILRRVLIV